MRDLTRTGSMTNGVKNIEIYGQNSLPLIQSLSSPGRPEIIIFGHVGAILRRPTMFRMHNLNQQVDKKIPSEIEEAPQHTLLTLLTLSFICHLFYEGKIFGE